MADDYVKPGSIDIQKCELVNFDETKTVTITNLVYEFNIFESLNKGYITANFAIVDSVSLLTEFPIVGQEKLFLKFRTPDSGFLKSVDLELRVIGIEKFRRESARTSNYVLLCATPDFIINNQIRIRKAYSNMSISEMANLISEEYLGETMKNTSVTEGLRTIVIPNMTPYQALNFLIKEAKSEEYVSSAYVFYRNADGIYFEVLDEKIDPVVTTSRLQGMSLDKYTASETDVYQVLRKDGNYSGGMAFQSTKPKDFLTITNFEFISIFNYSKLAKLGGLDNKVRFIDPITSFYLDKTYNYNVDSVEFKKTSQNVKAQFLPDQNFYVGSGDSALFFEPTNIQQINGYPYDQKIDMMHLKIGSKALFENLVVSVTIPGDSEKRIGNVIDLEFPAYGGTEETEKELNKFISGEYLILSLRHIWNNLDGYQTVMTCAKNVYEKEIA